MPIIAAWDINVMRMPVATTSVPSIRASVTRDFRATDSTVLVSRIASATCAAHAF